MSDEARRSTELTPGVSGDALVVLVLEDDETDRRRLIKFARRAGLRAEFHEAQDLNGLAANLAARRFDLIYVDYHLGLATGKEALDLIFARPEQEGAMTIMVTSVETPAFIMAPQHMGQGSKVAYSVQPSMLSMPIANPAARSATVSA